MPLTPIGEIIKNAAPNGANIGNGSSEIKADAGYNFCNNITSNQKQNQGLIESLLPHGAENAITAEQISKTLGISSVRYVRRLVSNERQSGRNILSTNASGGGYFLPDSGEKGRAEMVHYVNTIRAKARKTLAAATPAIEALKHDYNQITWEDLL